MIKFTDSNNSFADSEEMTFDSNSNYQDYILNEKLHFIETQNNDFSIGQNSDPFLLIC